MIKYSIKALGEVEAAAVYRNLSPAALIEDALRKNEGILAENGALVVDTGKYTGRAAKDRYIVDRESIHDEIGWGSVNKPISVENAEKIHKLVMDYLNGRELYVFDGFAGADPKYRKNFRIITELASQNLFAHQLLIRPEGDNEGFEPDFTLIAVPNLNCDPEIHGTRSEAAIVLDFEKKLVVVVGSQYSGEIKKSVFSVMNYLLPKQGVLPMHCSANIGPEGDTAVFFGLSGTGKTTLSTDPERKLIGDDEHGWAENSVFNFEGGCYAKCAHLSKEGEADIYNAIRFGALVENVAINKESRKLDFEDLGKTENTRVGYPLSHIDNIQPSGMSESVPKTIVFLTADAFGVLPPISKLDKYQAMYYFASGFTAKVAGTENGIVEPVPTFSACFGDPFLPLPIEVYVRMLAEKIEQTGANVYLINTGWNGTGKRMKLGYTRSMVKAALSGELEKAGFEKSASFGLSIPVSCPDVPAEILRPESTWEDKEAFAAAAKKLAELFEENISKQGILSDDIKAAGPKA